MVRRVVRRRRAAPAPEPQITAVPPQSPQDVSDIRTWAAENGFTVSAKGRIPREVLAAFENRNRPKPTKPTDGWTITTDWSYNGRDVTPGTELKIRGERGRFLFEKYVRTVDGKEWIDVIGGEDKNVAYRSFRPDRIQTVHRIQKTRSNAA